MSTLIQSIANGTGVFACSSALDWREGASKTRLVPPRPAGICETGGIW